jgi:hypothetical protein
MTRSAVAFGPLVPLILATTGCSLLFVHGPPDGYQEMESFSCTESRVLPILDVVEVGANIYGTARRPLRMIRGSSKKMASWSR